MNKEIEYVFKKFQDALSKLREGALGAKTELETDGVIQRFEFSFELFWKTIKIVLREKGIEAKTPRDCLQEAFKLGWLKDEKTFLDMMEDRNKTSHIYDKSQAEEIFSRIKSVYLASFDDSLVKIKTAVK